MNFVYLYRYQRIYTEVLNPYTNLEHIKQIHMKAVIYFNIQFKYLGVYIFRYKYENPYFLQYLEPENCQLEYKFTPKRMGQFLKTRKPRK